jgi:hypothetical protein
MNIEARITKLKAELHDHTNRHDQMIAEHQRSENEFNQQVIRSQTRYQQIAGAIAELELMLQESQEKNGDEPATTTATKNRLAKK